MVHEPPPADAPRWPSVLAIVRDGGRPLALLLLLALALKLLVALAAAKDPLAAHPTSDARYYLDRALGLAGRVQDPLADEPYHLPPLYPWLLRFVPGVLDGAYGAMRAVQALLGTALLAGVYAFARRRLSRPAALLAVALTLLYGPLTFYETRLLGDQPACVLLVALLVACDALSDRAGAPRGAARGATAGVLLGLAALLRPQALLLAPVLAPWAWRRDRGAALGLAAALTLVLLPSVVHNARSSGGLVLVSDNGGVNLWLAQTGPRTGTFMAMDESFGDIATQAAAARAAAERVAGHPVPPAEVSGTLARAALADMAARPGELLARVGLRARALGESVETDIVCFPDVERALIPPLLPLALPFGLLLGLAAGAGVLGARSRAAAMATGDGARPAPVLPAWAVAGMVVATALLFFHYSRFRLPLVPLLATAAASGADRWRGARPSPGRVAAALAAVVALTAVSYLPAPHHAPMRANAYTSLGAARLATATPGDLQAVRDARDDALDALQEQPGFVRALLLAARASLALGEFEASGRHAAELERASPGFPPAVLHRAWLAAIDAPGNPHHDPAEARRLVDSLRPAAAGDPSLRRSLDDLQRALDG